MANNIKDILTLQDVQTFNGLRDLRDNPAKMTQFINDRKADLYNRVTAEHSDNFEKVHGDMIRAGDTLKNVAFYHVRNKDLDKLQQTVLDTATNEANAATFDSQVAKRQFEINEWTSGNKMDTLFVMQLTFIALMITAPLLYLVRAGWLPMSVFGIITFLLLVALILTFVVRFQYTYKTRDYRFWNRRRFAKMGGPPSIAPPICPEVIGAVAGAGAAVRTKATEVGEAADAGLTSFGARMSAIREAATKPM
jgi:hypothetical protein